MIYYILAVYAVASIVAYYYAISLTISDSLSTVLIWFAMPCLVVFRIASYVIEFPAYFILVVYKLLKLDTDGAADTIQEWIESE